MDEQTSISARIPIVQTYPAAWLVPHVCPTTKGCTMPRSDVRLYNRLFLIGPDDQPESFIRAEVTLCPVDEDQNPAAEPD